MVFARPILTIKFPELQSANFNCAKLNRYFFLQTVPSGISRKYTDQICRETLEICRAVAKLC